MSLAGIYTRSGMLDAHPGQDVLLNEAAGLYHKRLDESSPKADFLLHTIGS